MRERQGFLLEKDDAQLEERKTAWEREFQEKGEISSLTSCREEKEDREKTSGLVKTSPQSLRKHFQLTGAIERHTAMGLGGIGQ